MSEKKINVDMNLFAISGKSRKKRDTEPKSGIKVKTPCERKRNETLKKKSILKMIRNHQEERYKKLFDEKKTVDKAISDDSGNFNKDFKEAQIYLQTLSDNKKQMNNKTLRTHNPIAQSLLFQPSIEPLKNIINEVANPSIANNHHPLFIQPSIANIATPNYGCLKGGALPTYRTMINQTRKQLPPYEENRIQSPVSPNIVGGDQQQIMENRLNESMKRVNEMKETAIKLQQLKHNSRPKKMKRKKTIRRTYKIGRSKTAPKVSVLVSNKTIRTNISTKSQLIKQTPIDEVKRFLVKRGLIKVGSITPNDVLRKIYESTIMMCGEVHNHNPENLMYNFFNDKQ
jgi:hypothetical protein